jgi:hypothetical protein
MPNYYNVASANDWTDLPGTLNNGDIVNITNDFTTTSLGTKTFNTGSILDGNNFTITLTSSSMSGFVKLFGGTIQNVKINGNGGTIITDGGTIIQSGVGTRHYGTIKFCDVSNCTTGTNSGGLIGAYFGKVGETSLIDSCSSGIDVFSRSGGIVGGRGGYFTCRNCYFYGTFNLSASVCGGIGAGDMNADILYENCYNLAEIRGSAYNGGIHCYSSGSNSPTDRIRFYNCYNLGNITNGGSGGGIISVVFSNYIVDLSNCYSIGSITNSSNGALVGNIYQSNSVCNVYNCYSIYDNAGPGGGILGTNSGTLNYQGTVINGTDVVGSTEGIVNNNGNNEFTLTSIENNLPATWDPLIWTAGTYPMLQSFTELPWIDYTAYNSAPTLQNSATITYTNPIVFERNVAITPLSPTIVGGGDISNISVNPPLPTGLSIASDTGIISGTPTVATANATYTITAEFVDTNEPDAIFDLVLAVITFSYSVNPANYIQDTPITPNILTLSDDFDLQSTEINPDLPEGLSFNTLTGEITGTPLEPSVQQSYDISMNFTNSTITTSLSIRVSYETCFTDSAEILTNKGRVNIVDIYNKPRRYKIISHDGTESNIRKIHKFKYGGDLYVVKKTLDNPLVLSPEHRFKLSPDQTDWLTPKDCVDSECELFDKKNKKDKKNKNTLVDLYHIALDSLDHTINANGIILESWDYELFYNDYN